MRPTSLHIQAPIGILVFLLGCLAIFNLQPEGWERSFGLVESAYYSLGLFLWMNNPLGFPLPEQGAAWAVYLARAVYFAAPLVLAWTILEGAVRVARRVFSSPERLIGKMRDHVVIGGLGRVGNLLIETLGRDRVVVVQQDEDSPFIDALRRDGVPVLIGDMTRAEDLRRAGIERARGLITVSGDDIANLDACHIAAKLRADLHTAAQVTDVQLQRLVERSPNLSVATFNTYQLAVRDLVQSTLSGLFENRERLLVILAGVGRFGRCLAEQLISSFGQIELSLVFIDRQGARIGRVLQASLPDGERYVRAGHVYDGDIHDPHIWREIREHHDLANAVVILCTDNDVHNVNTALMIEDQVGGDVVVVSRMFRDVSFMENHSEGFRVAVLSRMVRTGLHDVLSPFRTS